MTTTALQPHILAVVEALEDAGLNVGNHVAPDPDNPENGTPYVVVHLSPGGTLDGNLALPTENADLAILTRSVGKGVTPTTGAEQALWMADQVRAALDGIVLTVAGRICYPMRLRVAADGALRDPDLVPPVFSVTDRWHLPTVPA